MKYIYGLSGIIFSYILVAIAYKVYFSLTGRFYSIEHASGTFSYIYAFVILIVPLFIGFILGIKSYKNKKLLFNFAAFFIFIITFIAYSATYAGYPFFS